ncbi:MAG: hypothetical protein ABIK83_10870 [Candidatus Zixiibacteriota bacterium]
MQEPDTVDAVPSFVIPALIIDASSFDYNSIGTGGEAIVGIGSSDNYGVSSGYLEVSGPSCTSGDADGSGGVDIDDVVYLINYIFSGGPAHCQTSAAEMRTGVVRLISTMLYT